jgi:hypothetical protein
MERPAIFKKKLFVAFLLFSVNDTKKGNPPNDESLSP